MISVKIDVSKIDKSHLFEGKNGARYLDIILIETPDSRFGNDYMVAQSVSKEARESGAKGPILGNGKIVGKGKPASKKAAAGEDVPF